MASIQVLKSGLYPFLSFGSSSRRNERLICHGSRRILKFRSKVSITRRSVVSCKRQDTDDDEIKGISLLLMYTRDYFVQINRLMQIKNYSLNN
jgi:hypothetical protein